MLAALEIYLHSIEIGQPDDLPMVATKDSEKIKYLTANRIVKLIRDVTKKVHPDLSQMPLFPSMGLRLTKQIRG